MMKIDRIKVYNKLNGHCGYCGKEITIKEMQVDHMNPQCLRMLNNAIIDGLMVDKTHDIENLMPSCRRCNHYKRACTVEEFRFLMSRLHERISKIYISKVAIDFGIIDIKPFDGLFYFEKNNQ